MSQTISFPKLELSFEVDKVAFNIFGTPVMWYGVIIGIGIVLAFAYGLYEVRKTKLSADDMLNMALFALPLAIVGARAYYVIFNFDNYRDNLWNIFAIREGGLAIYGGIIAAAITIVVYCRVKMIKIGLPFDLLAVGLPLAQAIGRWGNFVNGEAFGGPTTLPWAMTIENVATMVHPTFLYESIWNITTVILVLIWKKFRKFDGELFCIYMIWYGAGRFWIEGLRADSLYLGVFRISQIVAILSIVLGIGTIIKKRRMKKNIEG